MDGPTIVEIPFIVIICLCSNWWPACNSRDVWFHKKAGSLWNAQVAFEGATLRRRELYRVCTDLAKRFCDSDAREIVRMIDRISIEIEKGISAILSDRLTATSGRYDGRILFSRQKRLFHTPFHGLHLLERLSAALLRALFAASGKQHGLDRLFQELREIHLASMTRRGEQFGSLDLVCDDVIKQRFKVSDVSATVPEEEPAPLSAEEVRLFQSLGI